MTRFDSHFPLLGPQRAIRYFKNPIVFLKLNLIRNCIKTFSDILWIEEVELIYRIQTLRTN